MYKYLICLIICNLVLTIDQDEVHIQNTFPNLSKLCASSVMQECNENLSTLTKSLKALADYKNTVIDVTDHSSINENKAIIQQIKLLIYKKMELLRQTDD
jgi:hypothetical protein